MNFSSISKKEREGHFRIKASDLEGTPEKSPDASQVGSGCLLGTVLLFLGVSAGFLSRARKTRSSAMADVKYEGISSSLRGNRMKNHLGAEKLGNFSTMICVNFAKTPQYAWKLDNLCVPITQLCMSVSNQSSLKPYTLPTTTVFRGESQILSHFTLNYIGLIKRKTFFEA